MPRRDAVPDTQREHWESTFSLTPQMYGEEPSESGRYALERFTAAGASDVLELGAGQGRDTAMFLAAGISVTALDYTSSALEQMRSDLGDALTAGLTTAAHDVREPLPLPASSMDAAYAHMLFCMALSVAELQRLAAEVRRVLRPGGQLVYTVRHTGDAHCGAGIHHAEGVWETGGFAVHFFDRALVDQLATGYELIDFAELEEGSLPRRLWRITQRTPPDSRRTGPLDDSARPALRHLAQPLGQLTERDVTGALDVAGLPPLLLADVEQDGAIADPAAAPPCAWLW